MPHKSDTTMLLFRKVLKDLISDASSKDMSVINKIIAAIPLRIFDSQSEANIMLEWYFEKVI